MEPVSTFYTKLVAAVIVLCCLSLAAIPQEPKTGEERDTAIKKVIEIAISAHGGAKQLSGLRIRRMEIKGVVFSGDSKLFYTAEKWESLPFFEKVVAQLKLGNVEEREIRVHNRDKAWQKLADKDTVLLSKVQQAQMQGGLYIRYLMTLVPVIKDDGMILKYLGESTLENRLVLGIKVLNKDKDEDDVDLFFDKKNGLLVRCFAKPSNPASKQPGLDELMYDHKDFNGLKFPTLSIAYYGGKKIQERRVIEVEILKSIDMKVFDKP